jgi:hypothetical protein
LGNFTIYTQTQLTLSRQTKEKEVVGACGKHGREEEKVQGLVGKPEEQKQIGRGVDKRIGSKWILRGLAGREWIHQELVAGSCEDGDET